MGLIANGYAAGPNPVRIGKSATLLLNQQTLLSQCRVGSQYYGFPMGRSPLIAIIPPIKAGGMAMKSKGSSAVALNLFATFTSPVSSAGEGSVTCNFYATRSGTLLIEVVASAALAMTGRGRAVTSIQIGRDPTPEDIVGELLATTLGGVSIATILSVLSTAVPAILEDTGTTLPAQISGISGGGGSDPETVAEAVRTELAVELARIDVPISSLETDTDAVARAEAIFEGVKKASLSIPVSGDLP